MGLDQYWGVEEPVVKGQWRKHPNLHGWMEKLWTRQTGETDTAYFNCVKIYLTKEDLDQLESDVINNRLPETNGFFFGDGSDEYYKERDLEFIYQARKALDEGFKVFYDSWW